ncbi:MAG: YdbL family protein [Deltaproteobacteria bacterium]|nr:YdbL family protein [Deltaproteobacteria bacterium]
MKKISFQTIMAITFILLLCSSNLYAQGIKERMQERLPAVVELKKAGIVGENNLGYLEFVGATKKSEDIVTAENDDRKKVYEAIAKQSETTIELVGERRAKQIAEKADPGEWLKDEAGKWYQK